MRRIHGRAVGPLGVVAVGALVTILGSGGTPKAAVAAECQLPTAFGIKIEQRQSDALGSQGLFAASAQPLGAALVPGDAIRQANGVRVERCGDLERVTGEALANGLVLLLGVERGGTFTAVAVTAHPSAGQVREAPRAGTTESPQVAGATQSSAPVAREQAAPKLAVPVPVSASPRAPMPTSTPRRQAEVELPPTADASAALRNCAERAAQEFQSLDRMAKLSVPLVTYDRGLHDAGNVVATLHCGEDRPATTVQAYITETFGYYRTASEIRHFSADFQSRREVDARSGQALTMPYYSDSDVTQWVESYPFLRASLIESPRETRFLLPGERSGRWSPDRAAELLWEHARSRVVRLAEWAAAPG